jgi:hypothetical protein
MLTPKLLLLSRQLFLRRQATLTMRDKPCLSGRPQNTPLTPVAFPKTLLFTPQATLSHIYKITHCFFFRFPPTSVRCAGTSTALIASSNTAFKPFCLQFSISVNILANLIMQASDMTQLHSRFTTRLKVLYRSYIPSTPHSHTIRDGTEAPLLQALYGDGVVAKIQFGAY